MDKTENGKKFYKRWWFWVGAVLVLLIIIGLSSNNPTPSTSVPAPDESSATAQTQAAPEQPAPAKPTPKSVPAPTESQPTPAPTQPQSAPAAAPAAMQTLLNISGSGSKTTESFTAAGDWNLIWSYDCSNFDTQGNFQVTAYDPSGQPDFSINPVNELGASGSDTEYYHQGGTYYLVVNSECNWTVTVKG
jgi:hypothetical protein